MQDSLKSEKAVVSGQTTRSSPVKPLSMGEPAEQGKIVSIGGGKPFLHRMISMGLTLGGSVTVLSNEKKSPLLVRVMDKTIGINRRDASLVEIKITSPETKTLEIGNSGIKNSGISESMVFWSMAICLACLPVSTTVALVPLVIACAVVVFTGRVLIIKTLIRQRWAAPAILFVLLPWVGLLYSRDLSLGWDYALKTKYWAAMLIMAGLSLTLRRVHILLTGFWLIMALGAVLAMFQMAGFLALPANGYLGFGLVYTGLSMYLVIGILTASHYFRCTGDWKFRMGYLFLIAMFLFHLSVLEGRNGYFVMALVSPMVIQNLIGPKRWFVKILLLFLLIGGFGLSPRVHERVRISVNHLKQTQIIMSGRLDPDFKRPYIFHSSLQAFKSHPAIGIGTGSLPYYTCPGGECVTHPHNSILYMAVSFGVAGLICILWLFWTMFRISFARRRNPLGFFVLSVCVVIFFGGIFETPILNGGTCLLLPMAFGCLPHLLQYGDEKNLPESSFSDNII